MFTTELVIRVHSPSTAQCKSCVTFTSEEFQREDGDTQQGGRGNKYHHSADAKRDCTLIPWTQIFTM